VPNEKQRVVEAPRAAAVYERPEVERQQKLAEVTGSKVSGSAG
jgi:hypothetical protein